MKQGSNGSIDLNSILMSVNALVMVATVFAFTQMGEGEYINLETIVLAVLLSIQTHVALLLERKQRDPFVILLAFIMICYFSFRILTLTIYSYSLVFQRFPYTADDSNYALIFILVANTFLYAGFHKVKFHIGPGINFDNWRAATPLRAVFLLLIGSIFALIKDRYWTVESIPRVFIFLVIFASVDVLVLMAFAYWLAFAKSASRLFTFTIVGLILINMLLETLAGSRGVIVVLIQEFMAVTLAIAGCIQLKRKYVFSGILLLPVVLALLVGSFGIATFIRAGKEDMTFEVAQAVELARESNVDLEVVLPLLCDRAGYFDYSAEIIAHSNRYHEVINLPSYAKSLIDNLLTPGFDVFDQPRISQSLRFVYFGPNPPSKRQVEEEYHSDQLGVYGELYALFGYASLPLFFGLAWLLKRIYVRLQGQDPFNLALKRVIVLVVFVQIVNSFGFDWMISDTLVFATTLYIYRSFFRSRLYVPALVY